MVQVDLAGPRLPQTYTIIPDDVGRMASQVLSSCVTGPFEIGGFATSDLQVMNNWLTREESPFDIRFRTFRLIPSCWLGLCIDERVRPTANILNIISNLYRLSDSYHHPKGTRLAVPRRLRPHRSCPFFAIHIEGNRADPSLT